jgi:hypothetical protein
MTRVFVGGSRRISRLNEDIRARLDNIIDEEIPVLIGDANGADKTVQAYLHSRGYENVEVFCMKGNCRNNVGNWKQREVDSSSGATGREYYTLKDEQMTKEATVGLMLWDGESRGTLANAARLLHQEKKVVIYLPASREFRTLRTKADLRSLSGVADRPIRERARKQTPGLERKTAKAQSQQLF